MWLPSADAVMPQAGLLVTRERCVTGEFYRRDWVGVVCWHFKPQFFNVISGIWVDLSILCYLAHDD